MVISLIALVFLIISFSIQAETVKIEKVSISIERDLDLSKLDPIFKNQKQQIFVDVPVLYFPEDDKFFKDIKNEIISDLAPFYKRDYFFNDDYKYIIEFRGGYKVGQNNDRIFSIEISWYEYDFGAAHGNSSVKAVNIDMQRKRKIQFFDVFQKKYLPAIKDLLKKRLDQRDCPVFPEDYKKFIPDIFIKNNSIEFLFPKYEVTPGACGSFVIEVGNKKLENFFTNYFKNLKMGQ